MRLCREWVAAGCVLGCVTTWIAMAEILQDVQSTYPKPLFIAYCIRSSFTMCLLVVLIPMCMKKGLANPIAALCKLDMDRRLVLRLALRMILLTFLVLIGGYFWYKSLSFTTVPTNTVVSQMLCVMVFGISVCTLGEKLTLRKFAAVGICFAGTAWVVLSGEEEPDASADGSLDGTVRKSTLGGVALALMATLTYAIYECAYDLFLDRLYAAGLPKNANTDPLVFLGVLGLCSFLTCWPLLLIFDWIGLEEFALPPDSATWRTIAENAILDTAYNAFLIVGIANSSPLALSAGVQFVVPVSYIVDIYAHEYRVTVGGVVGGVLLVVGFIGLTYLRSKEGRESHLGDLGTLGVALTGEHSKMKVGSSIVAKEHNEREIELFSSAGKEKEVDAESLYHEL